jgi:hypothetical protein
MAPRRNTYNVSNTFLQDNTGYFITYHELCKEATVWNNSGQYWLGKEAERRAKCLLNGDVNGYMQHKKQEELFIKTRKFM